MRAIFGLFMGLFLLIVLMLRVLLPVGFLALLVYVVVKSLPLVLGG